MAAQVVVLGRSNSRRNVFYRWTFNGANGTGSKLVRGSRFGIRLFPNGLLGALDGSANQGGDAGLAARSVQAFIESPLAPGFGRNVVIAPGAERRRVAKGIAPGAERRRVPFGGRPQFRQAPSVRLWRTAWVFMAPWAHRNEFDRRGHKKPAPLEGRGRLTQLGGERGIRTPGTVTRTRAFQARSFSHSDTSPGVQLSRGGLIVGLQR